MIRTIFAAAAGIALLTHGDTQAQTPLTALPAESVVAATILPFGVNVSAALDGYEETVPPTFAPYNGPDLIAPFAEDQRDTHVGPLTVSTPMPSSAPNAMPLNGAEESGAFGEYADAPFAWGVGQVVRF